MAGTREMSRVPEVPGLQKRSWKEPYFPGYKGSSEQLAEIDIQSKSILSSQSLLNGLKNLSRFPEGINL